MSYKNKKDYIDYFSLTYPNLYRKSLEDQKDLLLNFEGFNKEKILFIKNKNPRKALAEAASNYYKKKPKNIIALTGTNGKTSISNFFYQILSLSKKKVAAIGTLGVLSKKIKLKTNNTTIDPIKMHQILQKLKNSNIDNVII